MPLSNTTNGVRLFQSYCNQTALVFEQMLMRFKSTITSSPSKKQLKILQRFHEEKKSCIDFFVEVFNGYFEDTLNRNLEIMMQEVSKNIPSATNEVSLTKSFDNLSVKSNFSSGSQQMAENFSFQDEFVKYAFNIKDSIEIFSSITDSYVILSSSLEASSLEIFNQKIKISSLLFCKTFIDVIEVYCKSYDNWENFQMEADYSCSSTVSIISNSIIYLIKAYSTLCSFEVINLLIVIGFKLKFAKFSIKNT